MIEHSDVASRAELGLTRRALDHALATGLIIRARRDHYVYGATPRAVEEAVRIGGRLTCLSLLQLLGVFVFHNDVLHVQIARGMSRLRSSGERTRSLESRVERRQILHWRALAQPQHGTGGCVGIIDALVHSVLCQPPRYAIATLDSALNAGLIRAQDLGDVFAALPQRLAFLCALIDGRAQSGPETLVRLMVRGLGKSADLQVWFDGVGSVDLVIDGWLVIECDSEEFHSSWQQQVKDRNRDLALAARGYSTLRLTAAQIMYRPEEVVAAIRGLLATHPECAVAR